jgi:hypothetical protein
MKRRFSRSILSSIILGLFVAAFAFAPVAGAVEWSEWEYEPGEGLHREEWYDPSDWFDRPGEGISYEADWWDYSYRYNDPSGYYGYYEPYGYGYVDRDYNYYTNEWYDDRELFDF